MVRCAFAALLLATLWLGVRGQADAFADVSRSFSVPVGAALMPGELASTEGNGTEVEAANTENGARLVGAVVTANGAPLALEVGSAQHAVQVVSSGNAEVYATTMGGDIHAGDAVSVSPVDGFGMKAVQSLRIVGIAQANLTGKTPGVRPLVVKDQSGRSHTVYMGAVPIIVEVGNGSAAAPSSITDSLQSLATVVAGHQVSALQAILSFAIVVISVGALMALIYGAIHAGIVAIGRNPLAKRSILRSVLQILGMGLLIAAVAAAALYFTLRP